MALHCPCLVDSPLSPPLEWDAKSPQGIWWWRWDLYPATGVIPDLREPSKVAQTRWWQCTWLVRHRGAMPRSGPWGGGRWRGGEFFNGNAMPTCCKLMVTAGATCGGPGCRLLVFMLDSHDGATCTTEDPCGGPCSLVAFWAGLGWLVLVYCERKILLAGWFELVETNKRTGWMSVV